MGPCLRRDDRGGVARVERIYANPRPIIEKASALLRSVPE